MNVKIKIYLLAVAALGAAIFCVERLGGLTLQKHNMGILEANSKHRDAIEGDMLQLDFLGARDLTRLNEHVVKKVNLAKPAGSAVSPQERANLQQKIESYFRANLTKDADAFLSYRFPKKGEMEFAPTYAPHLRSYLAAYADCLQTEKEAQAALAETERPETDQVFLFARLAYEFMKYDPLTGTNRKPAQDGIRKYYDNPAWNGVAPSSLEVEFRDLTSMASPEETLGSYQKFGHIVISMCPTMSPAIEDMFAAHTTAKCAFARMVIKTAAPYQAVPVSVGFYWNDHYQEWVPFIFGVGFSEPHHFQLLI